MLDENNDYPDIQWQSVPMGKKRPHGSSPLNWKRPAFLDTPGTSSSANRFDLLRDDHNPDNENHKNAAAMEASSEEINDDANMNNNIEGEIIVKPPPIFLSDVNNISGMMSYICKSHVSCLFRRLLAFGL
ncbi:uncharacterized protein [Eurosta solidaginis]|uniref:uncharacterized protein n=1 Tax=Eurosta solidaginis TaxID=178769 RepID=UPI003530928C